MLSRWSICHVMMASSLPSVVLITIEKSDHLWVDFPVSLMIDLFQRPSIDHSTKFYSHFLDCLLIETEFGVSLMPRECIDVFLSIEKWASKSRLFMQ